jgi:hypothetical protein
LGQKVFEFDALEKADLFVDAVYRGGRLGHVGDDPIGRLVPVGNQGGFRYTTSLTTKRPTLLVRYSDPSNLDWPDSLDTEFGRFVYFGDNREPGHELHNTSKKGNETLRWLFEQLHNKARAVMPPILVFTKAGAGRDVVFRGLAVPGADGMPASEDLTAAWRLSGEDRFQNYKATFTILDVPIVSRTWLTDAVAGTALSAHAPPAWAAWQKNGRYRPLVAEPVRRYRTPAEQGPVDQIGCDVLDEIVGFFSNHPEGRYAFEPCALEICKRHIGSVVKADLTRPWRDGGRDALGKYSIGSGASSVEVDFALEAKCKSPSNGCNVREIARLVARLRHRQFGVFVTTSFLNLQAYKEIVEDGHPIMVMAGRDIVDVLRRSGISTASETREWLERYFTTRDTFL